MPAEVNRDLADYLLDHYGSCRMKERCLCNAHKRWLGRGCLHWVPWGFTAWEQIQAHLKKCLDTHQLF